MAQKLNLIIDQGTTFITTFNLNDDNGSPINLAGYSGAAQVRKHYTSTNATSMSVSLGSGGLVTLSLSANSTGSLTAGRYLYDVELTDPSGDISRVVEGIVTVTPGVTR